MDEAQLEVAKSMVTWKMFKTEEEAYNIVLEYNLKIKNEKI